jgi:hypothetical protein
MPKYIRNKGQEWSSESKKQLREFASEHMPTRVIALKLGRTEGAIYTKASELGVHLGTKRTSRS